MILQPFLVLTADEVSRRPNGAQIASAGLTRSRICGPIRSSRRATAGAKWARPVGPIPALLARGRTDAFEPRMDDVPALGQHIDSSLREMGWDDKRIAAMHTEKAV